MHRDRTERGNTMNTASGVLGNTRLLVFGSGIAVSLTAAADCHGDRFTPIPPIVLLQDGARRH